jgi:diguanylate cyclase (GGDEF)-like protein
VPISRNSFVEAMSVEQNRRRYILLFVSYITSAIMLVLGLRHLFSDDHLLQGILFGCACCFLLNVAWFHASQQLETACLIEGVLVSLFVFGLVIHGGHQQTALFWVFPFPPILYGLLGSRRGTLLNLGLFAALALVLYGPAFGQAQYDPVHSSRFLASLLTLILASAINEHFRARNHHSMDLLQRNKEQQANTDALTGLANRRFLDQSLPQHLQQQPDSLLPMALVLADLDHFKHINDSFGHAEGDKVLQQMARLFRQKLRQPDICGRYGGEEFLLLLPHTQLSDAVRVAEKIRQAVAQQRFLPQHPELVITCSFGVSIMNAADDFELALAQADQLLYQAKAEGRNLVRS